MTTTTLSLGAALNAGLRRALEHDRKVVIMGEDVGRLGGVFRVTDTLQKDFGDNRVIDTPLAESGIVGAAFGMALRGFRPVCEIQFDGFVHMIQQSVAADDPVVFFEPKRRYWDKAEFDVDAEPDLPLHQARVARVGTDATIVAYGSVVPTALSAAAVAADEGHSLEVIDLRSLSPIDFDTIEESVRKTGRLVVAHEASTFAGLGAEIAARISERCFYQLDAPVLRVGGFDVPYPPSKLELHHLPDADRLLDAVDRSLAA
ncbi:MAG: alpha-ketoacid dehydrogenase subunit beta [Rhodococcus sp. (in: high G+C Gram-positive bacteria)]|nr:MAG: alpha-ketoacid dehydrogenase subunit beta [Rhodococcus sp. (in: high G+C Gram-positive bacteria)]